MIVDAMGNFWEQVVLGDMAKRYNERCSITN